MRWLVLSLLVSTAACAATRGFGSTDTQSAHDAAVAGVVLTGIDGNILQLEVKNLSSHALFVYRDKVWLSTSKGRRYREPGGAQSHYTLAPHQTHKLYVRFDARDLPADEIVELHLEDAIVADGGTRARLPPIPFRVL